MTTSGKLVLGIFAIGLTSSSAWAMPILRPSDAARDDLRVQVRYGYGPLHHGIYGSRRAHRHVANGTGYRGRGTRTGGPVGGLPNRN